MELQLQDLRVVWGRVSLEGESQNGDIGGRAEGHVSNGDVVFS